MRPGTARSLSSLARAAVAALAAASAGCPAAESKPEPKKTAPPPVCTDYTAPADFNAQVPAVSFSKDVLPIFRRSCVFSSCHGKSDHANGVFLGRDGPPVHPGIVNVKTDELPTMPFITPGDPRASYLMRKMDGSHCALDAQCTGATCKASMPKGEKSLDIATRDIVRRWIAQGAKDD